MPDFDKLTTEYTGPNRPQITFIKPRVIKWTVEIPKGGTLQVHYYEDISFWQRLWLKSIGWGVTKG